METWSGHVCFSLIVKVGKRWEKTLRTKTRRIFVFLSLLYWSLCLGMDCQRMSLPWRFVSSGRSFFPKRTRSNAFSLFASLSPPNPREDQERKREYLFQTSVKSPLICSLRTRRDVPVWNDLSSLDRQALALRVTQKWATRSLLVKKKTNRFSTNEAGNWTSLHWRFSSIWNWFSVSLIKEGWQVNKQSLPISAFLQSFTRRRFFLDHRRKERDGEESLGRLETVTARPSIFVEEEIDGASEQSILRDRSRSKEDRGEK